MGHTTPHQKERRTIMEEERVDVVEREDYNTEVIPEDESKGGLVLVVFAGIAAVLGTIVFELVLKPLGRLIKKLIHKKDEESDDEEKPKKKKKSKKTKKEEDNEDEDDSEEEEDSEEE